MLTTTVDTSGFNAGIAGLINKVGLNSRTVIEKETGELIKTLVKFSPPSNLQSSKRQAEKDVRKTFRPLPKDSFKGEQAGRGKVRWLYASKFILNGVLAENYLSESNANSAKPKIYAELFRGKQAHENVGKRGRQDVVITNRKTISRQVYSALVQKVKANFGRLKAGWAVAIHRGQIKTSGRSIPAWVGKHVPNARGKFENNLAQKTFPSFTISNHSVGISNTKVLLIVESALAIRAKAMAKNAAVFLSGKKPLSSYAK